MSDFLRGFLKSQQNKQFIDNSRKKSFLSGWGEEDQLTPTEQETLPYLRAQVQNQEQEKSWLTPLELVFDLLSRGQYMGANIAQDIAQGKGPGAILAGGLQGLTGERKGDWTTTLFGGKDKGETEDFAGIFPGHPLGGKEGKIPILSDIPVVGNIFDSWEGTIGLLANIFLDPSTYFTWGTTKGATAANKASARFAAKEVAKRAIFNKANLDDLAKVAKKGFDPVHLEKLWQQGVPKAQKYLREFVSAKDLSRFNARVFNDAYRKALTSTGAEFTQDMLKGLAEGSSEFLERASSQLAEGGTRALKGRLKELARLNPGKSDVIDYYAKLALQKTGELDPARIKEIYKQIIENGADAGVQASNKLMSGALERYKGFADEIARVSSQDFAASVAKLGERKVADVFGLEIGKGIRKPNILAQTSDRFKDMIRSSKLGEFGRAVSAKLDDGPVGAIKRALGIRNPYQEMLNSMKMENHYLASSLAHDEIGRVENIFGGVSDDLLKKTRDVIDYGKSHGMFDLQEMMNDPGVLKIVGNDAEKVRNLVLTERHLVDDWFLKESELAKKGLLAEYEPMANYLPHRNQIVSKKIPSRELGTFKPGFTKHQDLSLEYIAKQDAALVKQMLGVDDATAQKIVGELGWSSTNMDLKEMLMYRAYAHARALSNANLVEQFSQFGIRPDIFSGSDLARQAMERTGENAFSGLRQVQSSIPAINGMYFDQDVADIIDRVIPVTSSDKGLKGLKSAINYATTMFKSYATLAPGFHLRNWRSNIITGFINYGPGFLNPKRNLDAMLISAYGLYGEAGLKKIASKVGLSNYAVNTVLERNVAGKTIRQWTDDVLKKNGIISKASMGYGLEDYISKIGEKKSFLQKINPGSRENVFFKGSRDVGAVIESGARVEGFLYDLEKMAGKGGVAAESMVNEAVRNVKKYFFDYEDLSEVEKKYLKQIIPFYSWIRKNVALQVHQLIDRTGTMSGIAKGIKAMEGGGWDQEDVPDYIRQQAGVPVGKTAEGLMQAFFPDLPYKDINQVPMRFEVNEAGVPIPHLDAADAWDNFLSMAHPVFKTVTTLSGAGWDPFTKHDLSGEGYAPRAFRILGNNPELFAAIDATFKAVGIKDGIGLHVDPKSGKLKMDAQAAKILEDNMLLLRRLDDMGNTISTVFPELETQLANMTGIKDRYEGMDKTLKTMSFALGLSQRDIDLEKENEYKFREALRAAEEERRKDKSKTPGAQMRSQKYFNSYQKRIRRLRSAVQ